MALEALNQQLANSWRLWPQAIIQNLVALPDPMPLAGSGVTLSNLRVDGQFTSPPEFTALTRRSISIALPHPKFDSWSVDVTGFLSGAFLGQKILDDKPVRLQLANLRLTLNAEMDDSDPALPRVTKLDMDAILELILTAYRDADAPVILELAVGPNAPTKWQKATDGSDDLLVTFRLKLDALIGKLNNVEVDGELRFNMLAASLFRLSFHLGGASFSFALPVKLPVQLAEIEKQIAAKNLPVRWGDVFPVPEPDAGHIGDFDLHREAVAIGAALRTALPQGAMVDRVFHLNHSQPVPPPRGFAGERDSAIWTGHYLAAEAFHYAAAARALLPGEQMAALERVYAALAAVERLFEVPQAGTKTGGGEPGTACERVLAPLDLVSRRGLLCRAVLPQDQLGLTRPRFDTPGAVPGGPAPACEDPQSVTAAHLAGRITAYFSRPAILPDALTPWYGFGRDMDPPSRDQLIGVMLGLAAAYKLVPDPDIRSRTRRLVLDLVAYLVANGWNYPTPTGKLDLTDTRIRCSMLTSFINYFHMQLAFLSVAKMVDEEGETDLPARYDAAADGWGEFTWAIPWTNCLEPVSHYFKFNLDNACLAMLLFLGADPGAHRADYMAALQTLRQTLGHHRNAYFNLLWILGHPDAERAAHWADPVPYSKYLPPGITLTVEQETVLLLRQWLHRRDLASGPDGLPLQETPAPTYLFSLPGALLADYTALGANLPELSTFPLPVHVRPGRDMDFLWQRPPFLTGLSTPPTGATPVKPCPDVLGGGRVLDMGCCDTVSPGVDYLLAFWMAAYLGIVPLSAVNAAPAPPGTPGLPPPLDDGAVRAATTPPSIGPLDSDLPGDYASTLNGIAGWFERLEVVREGMKSPGINPGKTAGNLKDFAHQTLTSLLYDDAPERFEALRDNLIEWCNKKGVPDVAQEDFENLGLTFLEWLGRVTGSPADRQFAGLLLEAALQCLPNCVEVLQSLSTREFLWLPAESMFSPAQRAQLVTLVRDSALGTFGLPWGPAFEAEGRTIGQEVALLLGEDVLA